MHTKDKLATALRELGLTNMADKAEHAWYDDYLSPLDTPIMTLVDDLAVESRKHPERSDAILALRSRAMHGDFDATTEESDAWAASEEGQAAFRLLMRK
ncbi:MAG TPA: hypothetical protein VHT00_14110 [Stellaceae bacterium]|jgi:hypothetical protein|nr:hypothetical protein [Stellaceae bacterium]